MWEIEFFEKTNGRVPVDDFLSGLSKTTDLPYIDNAFDQLREHGYKLDRPHASYLRDDIYELRIKTINGKFRLLYFFFDGNRIIITNGFKKDTGEVPPSRIKIAIEFRKTYNQRKQNKL